MALWNQTQQLPAELLKQVECLYGDNFRIEIRHFLAPWIEDAIWPYVEGQLGEPDQETAQAFLTSLLQQIKMKAESMIPSEMFVSRVKLTEAGHLLLQRYHNSPYHLFKYVVECLKKEWQMINNVQSFCSMELAPAELKYSEFKEGFNSVRASAAEANDEIRQIESEQESFAINYHECTKHKAQLHYMVNLPNNRNNEELKKNEVLMRQKIADEEISLNAMITRNMNSQIVLTERLKKNIDTLADIQRRVLDEELIKWKREQQLVGNGGPEQPNYLNTIQEWCENLADLIWLTRQQIKDALRLSTHEFVKPPTVPERLKDMINQITKILSTLVMSTFVVEKQPPQVMKTNTKFASTVRLLVGGQLNVHMNPPQVQVMIITESQAQHLLQVEAGNVSSLPRELCGEILNNTGSMEYQNSTKQLSVSFRNMALRKIKRAEKKGTESVMDEKLTLLFSSQFKVGGGELTFQVWVLSLPVVVIVHGNQEPFGWATVTWDNAFALPARKPFSVPDAVPWGQLAETLNMKFHAATGRKLTDNNLRFLAEKIFNRSPLPASDHELNNMKVTWLQFCKEPLADRTFTFWEWFYAVMKVTREYLKDPWRDGLILGFIQKRQAEETLSKCPTGTFLLRFSDSELGGITIALVHVENELDGPEVLSVQPFTAHDLKMRSLADRINDLPYVQFLYREDGMYLPKEQAFFKYIKATTAAVPTAGYVPITIVTDFKLPDKKPKNPNSPQKSPMYNYGSDSRDSSVKYEGGMDGILDTMFEGGMTSIYMDPEINF